MHDLLLTYDSLLTTYELLTPTTVASTTPGTTSHESRHFAFSIAQIRHVSCAAYMPLAHVPACDWDWVVRLGSRTRSAIWT